MTDQDLRFVLLTLQQYLVEHGLFLNGEALDWIAIQETYRTIQYQPLPDNLTNLSGFTGFNLRALHRILLKFWYYSGQGLLQDIDYPTQYFQDFLARN